MRIFKITLLVHGRRTEVNLGAATKNAAMQIAKNMYPNAIILKATATN